MINVAIVGFGSRGQMFGRKIMADENVNLLAVAETVEASREHAAEFGVAPEMRFASADEFFAQGKICDAVFICTQDAQHIDMALKAMELGYDICLEKPAAVNIEDCIKIRDTANRLGRKVMLTHVMRYSPFYQYIKKLIVILPPSIRLRRLPIGISLSAMSAVPGVIWQTAAAPSLPSAATTWILSTG